MHKTTLSTTEQIATTSMSVSGCAFPQETIKQREKRFEQDRLPQTMMSGRRRFIWFQKASPRMEVVKSSPTATAAKRS